MRGGAGFRRDQVGQTLVVVALAVTVLLGAVALGVDAGYGLTQRRFMQNASDAGALAAGKFLATNVIGQTSAGKTVIQFTVHKEEVYCEAKRIADLNRLSVAPGTASPTLIVEYGIVTNADDPSTWWNAAGTPPGPSGGWTTSPTATCPASTTSGTLMDSKTRYVRVTAGESYRGFLTAAFGQPTITASAKGIVRLSGTPVSTTGPTWPMVRHYNPSDFNDCGNPCGDPTSAPAILFWSSSPSKAKDMVYGQFKGAVDFSRYSTYLPYSPGSGTNTPQLLTQWDRTGSVQAGTTPKTDQSGGNCGGGWDTAGDEDPQNHDKQCSIPNWFYYFFGGTFSLTSSRNEPAGGLGTRSAICPPLAFVPAPSCSDSRVGDWVETTNGDIGSGYGGVLADRVHNLGSLNRYSALPYPNTSRACVDPGGPSQSNCYGKALTVLVYLWDCAESFNGTQFQIIPGTGTDCSQIKQNGSTPTPNRVHIFAAAPFTFYEGLVSSNEISGFWGGLFGDPGTPTGVLNPLSNTALLIAGD